MFINIDFLRLFSIIYDLIKLKMYCDSIIVRIKNSIINNIIPEYTKIDFMVEEVIFSGLSFFCSCKNKIKKIRKKNGKII